MKYVIMLTLIMINMYAKETIRWNEYPLAPPYITTGELKGEGYLQLMENDMRNFLNAYEHVIEVNNATRVQYMMKNLPNICSHFLKSKEREKFMYFSIPSAVVAPNGLTIKREDFHKFKPFMDINNTVNLDKLISSNDFILAYKNTRSFGTNINKVIRNNKNSNSLISLKKDSINQIQLLEKNRIDGFFGYEIESNYLARLKKIDSNYLMFLSTQKLNYYPGYFACSKTPFGKKVILTLNEFIKKNRETSILNHYLPWVSKETKDLLRNNVKEIFIKFDKENLK